MSVITEYLTTAVAMLEHFRPLPEDFTYHGRDGFLLANGRPFELAVSQDPPKPVHAYMKQCFDNAYRVARRWPSKFRYVEGMALGVIPVHHAWVINEADEVLDPTWYQNRIELGSEYFGVIIPLEIVKQVRHRECLSVIDNWKRDWPLYREPWPVVLQRNAVTR